MYRYIGIIIAILTTSVSSYICISQNKKINELKRNLELKRNNNKGVSFNDVIDENTCEINPNLIYDNNLNIADEIIQLLENNRNDLKKYEIMKIKTIINNISKEELQLK